MFARFWLYLPFRVVLRFVIASTNFFGNFRVFDYGVNAFFQFIEKEIELLSLEFGYFELRVELFYFVEIYRNWVGTEPT